MDNQTINGLLFAKMVQGGCNNLKAHAEEVNDLNVFPIPDGDTGSNMLLTILGGAEAIGEPDENLYETSRRISNGMLLSARGNSGVILSQIFEGIADGFAKLESADSNDMINAFKEGVKHSYGAVMTPTEGTMLTVMREATENNSDKTKLTIDSLLKEFLTSARQTLEKTPDMLPVLKKAGVVDSGGAGLIYIFEGMLNALTGNDFVVSTTTLQQNEPSLDLNLFTEDSVLEYGYCTELLLRLQTIKTNPDAFEVSTILEHLKELGDSVVAFKTGSIVKIHIHTMTPDKVLAFCQRYGEFLKVKIENMSLQHNNTSLTVNNSENPRKDRKAYASVAVVSGDGIKQLFSDRGADVIVDGGQSMNPSTENFLEAFKEANADTVFVFPNNSNIILAAKQAAGMYKDSEIVVIESRNIGEGYAALSMLSYDSNDTATIKSELTDAMKGVETLAISKSVRDAEGVHAGEYIGFVGKNIIAAKIEREDAVISSINAIDMDRFDICILIRGKDSTEEESLNIEKYLNKNYPEKEVYLIDGMQDIYSFILILE